MLVLSAAAALAWANGPAAPSYAALLAWVPPLPPRLSLHAWVNDAVMVVFFLLVGLELRREIAGGALASPRRLAAPAIAALGGMLAPAAIFLAFNRHDPAALRGWAVPVATDIAFALAVLSILGARVPPSLKVFLTALAILDDLGAIVIIALFYTEGLGLAALSAPAALWLGLRLAARAGLRAPWAFALGGVLLWALVLRSGVHPTLAGVALAFAVPAERRPGEAASPAARLEHALHPWVAFGVLPVFGLANAGLAFGALPHGVLSSRLTLGIAAGLVIGKQLGVFGALVAAIRLGLAHRPAGTGLAQLYGAAALCGIGFTMSLFIGEIAFRGDPRGEEIKLAVFGASLVSAAIGLLVLLRAGQQGRQAPNTPLDTVRRTQT